MLYDDRRAFFCPRWPYQLENSLWVYALEPQNSVSDFTGRINLTTAEEGGCYQGSKERQSL